MPRLQKLASANIRAFAVGVRSVQREIIMELSILHVTDIHYTMDRVEQLKSWLETNKQTVDAILVSGDIADAPMKWDMSAEEQEEYRKNMETVLDSFTSVKNDVYFIPGNHDVLSVFQSSEETPDQVPSPPPHYPCNMHMKRTLLAPHLHLLGLGGCVPAYQDGNQIWDGFPYKSYEEMDKDLHKLLDPVFFDDTNVLPASDAVILMTHAGPTESDTSFIRDDPKNPIISGNKETMKLLCTENMQRNCVLNIHGHSHLSPGQCVVGKTRIINPGPLQQGCFGVYTLRQRPGQCPSWEVSSVGFHTLVTS